ncbi:DUF2207 domain-containing protein [Candidatus Microgenomates bacterium]|nr:MAG: DUF2207 domain-containing protein [Candidatus Microgenomates bacterium]
MKQFAILVGIVFFVCFARNTYAQVGYSVTGFKSEITINQDTSVRVQETIQVNFPGQKHGIYRDIPIDYNTSSGKTSIDLKINSVKNNLGREIKYSKSIVGPTVRIKIGDPKTFVTGDNTYVIDYTVRNVLERFGDYDELYWNAVGSGWDVIIPAPEVVVVSEFASIEKTTCYAGKVGKQEANCTESHSGQAASFSSLSDIFPGDDFTVVVGLNKSNQLAFPTQEQIEAERFRKNIQNFVSVVLASSPLGVFGFFWYKFGRDQRYVSKNIYYAQSNDRVMAKPVFAREHLPLSYMRVGDLTPAEAGTLIDERVDIQDISAEIMELARLGFISITREEKKHFIGKSKDFLLVKLKKDSVKLALYQSTLFEKLFIDSEEEGQARMSKLKNKFYKYLPEIRKQLYEEVTNKQLFVNNPEKVRTKWGVCLGVYLVVLGGILFLVSSNIFVSFAVFIASSVLGGLFVVVMPRRTAKGYGLYRQLKGLEDYLKRGKWRHEIAEKHLFLEEMLPMAISLGVVNELARDMKDLNVAPPSYLHGVSVANFPTFASDFKTVGASAIASPSRSGSSGFSGGSAGGGFGGGGGGSW